MQILIFSLLILALVVFLIYKIKQSFTKKELIGFFTVIILIIATSIYFNKEKKNELPNAFKKFYLKNKASKVLKVSATQTNMEVLSSDTNTYKFDYIISKNTQEFVCEAKDVEVIKIEDEYIFKNFKEKCRVK